MRSTYRETDVKILLKDITGLVQPQPANEREKLIQSGIHYCEMLPIEYSPSETYMEAYRQALKDYSGITAQAVGILADKIIAEKGEGVVLVSLARAGIPIGILVKRYIMWKYQIDVPHYSISIIRGRGIDKNALQYIIDEHSEEAIQFVDGWIGKGAILQELEKVLVDFPNVSSKLAVVADPANITELCGTHEDILIPSSCLNATISGLVSRTFLRDDIIGPNDYHGAVYYGELQEQDLSNQFLKCIVEKFTKINEIKESSLTKSGIEEVRNIAKEFAIDDVNLIKPGIGETTRVLLRRVPWKVLVNQNYKEDAMILHILKLAKEKNVPVEFYDLENYKTCGIIKKCADI